MNAPVNGSGPDTSGPHIFAPNIRPDRTDELTATLRRRIMVIDGAMGTAIQRVRPDEAGSRGERQSDQTDADDAHRCPFGG